MSRRVIQRSAARIGIACVGTTGSEHAQLRRKDMARMGNGGRNDNDERSRVPWSCSAYITLTLGLLNNARIYEQSLCRIFYPENKSFLLALHYRMPLGTNDLTCLIAIRPQSKPSGGTRHGEATNCFRDWHSGDFDLSANWGADI